MLDIREIIQEAESLRPEDKAILVDCLLRTLNSPDPEIDRKWIEVSRRRLAELRSGQVKAIPGDDVFKNIEKRFAQ